MNRFIGLIRSTARIGWILINFLHNKNPLNVRVGRLKFAMGGLTFRDKVNSYYLKTAMEQRTNGKLPSSNLRLSKTKPLKIKHSRFANVEIEYNLIDDYQMDISREFFFENIYDFKKVKFEPEQIIDCGAYKGYFSILASQRYPTKQIISIEPHPDNFKTFKNCIDANNIQNITLINKAISKEAESIKFFYDGSNGNINGFVSVNNYLDVVTLDIEELIDVNKSLLLKVDVEGAELQFFPDIISRLPRQTCVFLETHDSWDTLAKIKEEFIKEGFEFGVCADRGVYIDSYACRK
jgi:FkbM family methyltransferase